MYPAAAVGCAEINEISFLYVSRKGGGRGVNTMRSLVAIRGWVSQRSARAPLESGPSTRDQLCRAAQREC